MKTFLSMLITVVFTLSINAQKGKYASAKTNEVINKMMNAHGGYKAWKKTKTFSFDNIMYSKSLGKLPFWVNKVTVNQKTRQVYQEWPLHEAKMAYDGKKTWALDWKIGNSPKFEALFFYYFLNLPWITQDDNVKLSEAIKMKHKAFENEVYVVDMTFTEKPAVGKTATDTYKLYIDSKNYLLVGYEYTIAYGYMLDLMRLPKDKKFFGPMFRVHKSFAKVNGLVYPTFMVTGNTEQTQVYGEHVIFNYSLTKPFDRSKLKMPAKAILDPTSEFRKK